MRTLIKVMNQWLFNQKGSSSIEAALIIPLILVMNFFIVGGFIWYADSVHFEIFWNAQDLKVKNSHENGHMWIKTYGDEHKKNLEIPYVGMRHLYHVNSSFGGPMYETIRLARMGEKFMKEGLESEKPPK